MKKVVLSLILVAVASLAIYAQFPATRNAQWDANPTTDQVTNYILQVDSQASVTVPALLNAACNCIQQTFSIPSSGAHQLSLWAVNAWGTSTATILQFTADVPGKSNNLRIR